VKCFRFIRAERANHPVSLLCRALGVSRSGFHAFCRRPPCERALCDARLLERIEQIHKQSRDTYGAPRVHAELRREGVLVSRKRVERLMRAQGLSGLIKRRRGRTTIRVPGIRVADDLVRREWNPSQANQLWVADITHVPTWEGWLYLAVVVDCFSRCCIGWSMRDNLRAELVTEALEMAVARRRPDIGLVHHSDQGSQYVSLSFSQRCRDAGIAMSMGSKGCALDNAVCESFIGSLKKELLRRRSWPTKRDAQSAIFEWIEGWYNRRRLHSTLGYVSPMEYEDLSLMKEEAA
jgi:putative transposase